MDVPHGPPIVASTSKTRLQVKQALRREVESAILEETHYMTKALNHFADLFKQKFAEYAWE